MPYRVFLRLPSHEYFLPALHAPSFWQQLWLLNLETTLQAVLLAVVYVVLLPVPFARVILEDHSVMQVPTSPAGQSHTHCEAGDRRRHHGSIRCDWLV